MKRVCLLFTLMMILMTACTPAQTQDSQTSGANAFHEILVLSNPEKYEAYISTKRLPDDFVHWNSIAKLGVRIDFIPTKDFPSRYIYLFADRETLTEGTKTMQLEITHNVKNEKLPTFKDYQIVTVTRDMPDMRMLLSASGPSVIIRNGIEYQYQPLFDAKPGDPAGLNKIVWYHNGVRFELFGQIQTFSGSLMNGLLSISETEAAAAFAEIKQSLDARK